MTTVEVVELIKFLDHLFQLGGQLVAAAQQKRPELKTDPLPALEELDTARGDAVKRVE